MIFTYNFVHLRMRQFRHGILNESVLLQALLIVPSYNQKYNLENFSKAFPSFDTFVVVAESLTTDNLEYRILAY